MTGKGDSYHGGVGQRYGERVKLGSSRQERRTKNNRKAKSPKRAKHGRTISDQKKEIRGKREEAIYRFERLGHSKVHRVLAATG